MIRFASWAIAFFLLAAAIWAVDLVVFDYSKNFVHPNNWSAILLRSVGNGLTVDWSDILNAMAPGLIGESRPRFLTYLIEGFDYKIRLRLDEYVSIPPTFRPIMWVLHLLVAPFLLFRLVLNLGSDRLAATTAIAVYVSSIGFLSGIAMALAPGKSLATASLISSMYFLSTVDRENPDTKFKNARILTIAASLLSIFLGLFIDEVALFAFVLLPILFWPLFWNRSTPVRSGRPDWTSIALFILPAAAFLIFVVVVLPSFYEQQFGRRFDYLGNAFAIGESSVGAKSMLDGPHGVFGTEIVWTNFKNLLGVALVPIQISPLNSQGAADLTLTQSSNIAQFLALGLFFGAMAACAAVSNKQAVWLRRALLVTAVFVVLMTLLSIRHYPVLIGYYYGAGISMFMALLVGLAIAAVGHKRAALRFLAILAAAPIVFFQINNFMFVNERWRFHHYETIARPMYAREFRLLRDEVTGSELSAIRSAWKAGALESYLGENGISVGAIHLVYELRTIDRLKGSGVSANQPAR
jgi:hypothetical protein